MFRYAFVIAMMMHPAVAKENGVPLPPRRPPEFTRVEPVNLPILVGAPFPNYLDKIDVRSWDKFLYENRNRWAK